MAKTRPKTSWRVIAFSFLLAIVFLAVVWLMFGGHLTRGPEAGLMEQGAETDPAGGESSEPLAAGDSSAAAGEPAGEALKSDESLAGAVDPSGAEVPPGQLPLLHAQLEALNAAAVERAEHGAMPLRLYLVVPTVEVLVPVSRIVDAPPTLESQIQRAVEELISWRGGEMTSPLPAETVVREVWVSPGGIAFVDFASTLPEYLVGGSLEEIHAVYGVVATVTGSFPEIRAVQILVGGQEAETLDGHVDVSRPLLPQYDMVLSNPRAP